MELEKIGQHSVPRAAQNLGSIPFPGGHGKSRPGTEAWRGWQGFRAPPFPGELPVPCIGGPGEPDNRRWLALKQSGNPLHFAGTAHRRERSSPRRDHSSEPHGPTCPIRIE